MNFYIQIVSLQLFVICKNDINSVLVVTAICLTLHTISNAVSIFFVGDANFSNNIYNSFIDGIFLIVLPLVGLRNYTTLRKHNKA